MFPENGGGMTARQVVVLACVADHEDLNQMEIVERTGIDRTTAGDIVRRLASRGLVQQQRRPKDRRMQSVRLTAKGRKALASHAPKLEAIDIALVAALGKTRYAALLAALVAIASHSWKPADR
jgi:DNA-binding MarR family transcriptional regulator